jgi:PiT family inorganic phosphate transporter
MFEALAGADAATTALLLVGLLVAFGFEFVNGFHDTANAVATVIYTRSMRPGSAVAWSGLWNALGVLHASTTGLVVAFSIVHLLPVDLLVTSGGGAGIAMVFSLLLAAVVWNLGTWLFGLPASSSHALIGSVLGVGLAASWGNPAGFGSGVNWAKAGQVLLSLVLSPFIGFVAGAVLLMLARRQFRKPELHEPARPDKRPPAGVRALLIGACTGVSFAHGSNDGQKGIGLIMLILIGVLPAGFAVNLHAGPDAVAAAVSAIGRLDTVLAGEAPAGRDHVEAGSAAGEDHADWAHVRLTQASFSGPVEALRQELDSVKRRLAAYGDLKRVPRDDRWALRVEILRVRQAIVDYEAHHADTLSADVRQVLQRERRHLTRLTEYAPGWVPLGVALALGLGTMIGWKRIVVTVGEKIGERPMSYAQGTSAQLVTAGTILAADVAGAPVSTTHILSSAIAGSMAAGGSGLHASTLRSIALAWVLTLPATLFLGAAFFLLSRALVG